MLLCKLHDTIHTSQHLKELNMNITTATESLIAWIEGNTANYVAEELSKTHPKEYCDSVIERKKHKVLVGKKYLKVVSDSSVRFFVDATTGAIYMAASYASPAKGIRGNVLSETNGKEGFHYAGLGLTFVNYAR
jgi:Fe-S cluster assembly iron-binding protein IscA